MKQIIREFLSILSRVKSETVRGTLSNSTGRNLGGRKKNLPYTHLLLLDVAPDTTETWWFNKTTEKNWVGILIGTLGFCVNKDTWGKC